jgi:tripartite-type tricarboxylate transporter receptor subunit TctC
VNAISRRKSLALGMGALLAPVLPRAALSQAKYPDRAIRIVVPRAAGGPLDVIARQWAEQVRPQLGNVMIENMGGGGGSIGTLAVARATPDGYTLALSGVGELVINPLITPGFNFDPARDLQSICIIANLNCAIAVEAKSPVRSLKELVEYTRANPGQMSYGSAGAGTVSHLAGELFKHLAGVPDIVHVPYKGSAPAFVDLMAGNIKMMAFTLSGETIEFHRAGKIRILATATRQRVGALPEVPSGADAGYPEFVGGNFLGLFAPASTPKPIVDQIAEVTRQVMSDPAFKARMAAQSYELAPETNPADASRFVASETVKWTPIVRLAGLKKD